MANVASSSSSGGPSVLRPMYKTPPPVPKAQMEAYQRRHESRPVVVKAPPVQGGTLASVAETPPPSSSSSCGYRQGGPCERGAAAGTWWQWRWVRADWLRVAVGPWVLLAQLLWVVATPQGGVQKGHSLNAKTNPDGKHVMDEILTSPYAGPFQSQKSAPLRTHTMWHNVTNDITWCHCLCICVCLRMRESVSAYAFLCSCNELWPQIQETGLSALHPRKSNTVRTKRCNRKIPMVEAANASANPCQLNSIAIATRSKWIAE